MTYENCDLEEECEKNIYANKMQSKMKKEARKK